MSSAPAPYKPLTAKSFRRYRTELGFSAEQMSHLCGASSGRVVRKWEAEDNGVPEGVSRFLWVLQGLPGTQRARVIDELLDQRA